MRYPTGLSSEAADRILARGWTAPGRLRGRSWRTGELHRPAGDVVGCTASSTWRAAPGERRAEDAHLLEGYAEVPGAGNRRMHRSGTGFGCLEAALEVAWAPSRSPERRWSMPRFTDRADGGMILAQLRDGDPQSFLELLHATGQVARAALHVAEVVDDGSDLRWSSPYCCLHISAAHSNCCRAALGVAGFWRSRQLLNTAAMRIGFAVGRLIDLHRSLEMLWPHRHFKQRWTRPRLLAIAETCGCDSP